MQNFWGRRFAGGLDTYGAPQEFAPEDECKESQQSSLAFDYYRSSTRYRWKLLDDISAGSDPTFCRTPRSLSLKSCPYTSS